MKKIWDGTHLILTSETREALRLEYRSEPKNDEVDVGIVVGLLEDTLYLAAGFERSLARFGLDRCVVENGPEARYVYRIDWKKADPYELGRLIE